MEHFPHVPVEDEGRLHDDGLRDNFIARVFCLSRWHELERGGRTRGRLVEFHSDHKYLLLAHGRARYEALGRLVAHAKELRTEELYRRYLEGFTEALRTPPSPGRVTDVLSHMMGFFRPHLSAGDKQELLSLIDSYRRGLVPLVAPLTLVRHYVRKFELAYLERQVFLSPYPAELMLRNRP